MIPYLLCFGASILFAYIANHVKTKISFLFFLLVSVLIPVILASLRDISIGIDTYNYYRGRWAYAINSPSFGEYISTYIESTTSSDRFELIYAIFIGIIAKVFGNYQIYLFFVHLMIIGLFYIGAFRLKEYANPVYSLTLFFFLYYNHSLNVSRQYMAMALLFAFLIDIEKSHSIRYIIVVAIASLIHSTSLIGIVPLVIYHILYPHKYLQDTTITKKVIMAIAIISVAFIFIPLVQYFMQIGIVTTFYSGYFRQDIATPLIVRILLLGEAVALIFFWRKREYDAIHIEFFLFLGLAFLAMYQIADQIYYGKRVAAYFSFANIIALGILPEKQRNIKYRVLMRLVILLCVIGYWGYFYAYQNASRTIPYLLNSDPFL